MFERDYIDVDRFVAHYDETNYDPDEENLYYITEDGEWESATDDRFDDEHEPDEYDETW